MTAVPQIQSKSVAWGIDVSAKNMAIAAVGSDFRLIRETKIEPRLPKGCTDSWRLALLARQSLEAMKVMEQIAPPDIIAIELPINSKFQKATLMAAFGAISVGAAEIAGDAVVWLTPTQWRKAAGTNDWKEQGRALVEALPLDVFSARHPIRIGKASTKPSSLAQAQSVGPTNFDLDLCEARLVGLAGVHQLGVTHDFLRPGQTF